MNIPSSLCPGYRNVDTFALEEEYESDEEVCYVTLDLGDVEPKLVPSSNSYRLIVSSFRYLRSLFYARFGNLGLGHIYTISSDTGNSPKRATRSPLGLGAIIHRRQKCVLGFLVTDWSWMLNYTSKIIMTGTDGR